MHLAAGHSHGRCATNTETSAVKSSGCDDLTKSWQRCRSMEQGCGWQALSSPAPNSYFQFNFNPFTDRADCGMRLVVCTAVNSMRRWQTSNAADSKPALCRSVTCPPRHLDRESKRTARSDRHPRAGRFGWESKAVEATARDHRVCEVLSVPGHDAASLRSFCFVSRREGGVSRLVS